MNPTELSEKLYKIVERYVRDLDFYDCVRVKDSGMTELEEYWRKYGVRILKEYSSAKDRVIILHPYRGFGRENKDGFFVSPIASYLSFPKDLVTKIMMFGMP